VGANEDGLGEVDEAAADGIVSVDNNIDTIAKEPEVQGTVAAAPVQNYVDEDDDDDDDDDDDVLDDALDVEEEDDDDDDDDDDDLGEVLEARKARESKARRHQTKNSANIKNAKKSTSPVKGAPQKTQPVKKATS